MVSAVVPPGMTQGSTFMVAFPPPIGNVAPGRTPQPANHYAGVSVMAPPSSPAPPPQHQGVTVLPPPSLSTADPPYAVATPIPSDPAVVTPFASALDSSPSISAPARTITPASPVTALPVPPVLPPPNVGQAMMKVQVPPGTSPGSTIHVQVPGETRMIAAQVPPGVSEFHVAYEPTRSSNPSAPAATQAEELLLVRVPPGTTPGTTMHMQVPDEPGRLLTARVPPGNVSEFHVSYLPRNSQRGTPARNTIQQGNRGNVQSNQGSGMGNMMFPLLGGAAMGAATMAMFDHHHYNNNGYDDSAGYGDTGGDYGSGDFGGDF